MCNTMLVNILVSFIIIDSLPFLHGQCVRNVWVCFTFDDIFSHRVFFIVVILFNILFKAPNCPLNVHLICHTHLDAGWLYTFSEYFYGTGSLGY